MGTATFSLVLEHTVFNTGGGAGVSMAEKWGWGEIEEESLVWGEAEQR